VLLLFLVGLQFDFGHLRRHGRSALAISVAGIATPFALGVGLACLMQPHVAAEVPPLGFALFLGTALSITAIPVLGRIMMELGITRTRLGTITIAAAAFDDATGWVLLAAVTAVVRAAFDPGRTLLMVAETFAFTAFMALAARALLRLWVRRALRPGDGDLGVNGLAVLFVLLFACAVLSSCIGVFAVFGAFLLGAALSGDEGFRAAVNRRLRDFVTAFFLPLFFAYTGLRTDVGSLGTWQLWLWCALVSLAALAGKLGGCGLAAWATGHPPREAACVGAMMNTRGLMALVTTLATTPLLARLARGTELEAPVRHSGFLAGRDPAPPPADSSPIPIQGDRRHHDV
jgi:Kef-type K+ transport system membrane component KefB